MELFWSYVKLKGRDRLEDLSADGMAILEWILGKESEKLLTGLIWIMIGTSDGFL
jgi:hypothetical protein